MSVAEEIVRTVQEAEAKSRPRARSFDRDLMQVILVAGAIIMIMVLAVGAGVWIARPTSCSERAASELSHCRNSFGDQDCVAQHDAVFAACEKESGP